MTPRSPLQAAVDRIIPAPAWEGDAWPAGWDGGVGSHLASSDAAWASPALERLVSRLGAGFRDASAQAQDAELIALGDDPDLVVLRRLCWEGYYAARPGADSAGLDMVEFRPVPQGVEPLDPDLPRRIRSTELRARYDAVIIGSGPGGGAVARVLAAAGKEVLLLERAAPLPNSALRGDHLHGKRNAVYAPSAGPGAGHPRVHVDPDSGRETLVDGDGDASLYGLNAMALGGGTRLWQCMAWRFLPEDFAMRTVYGQPDGAALADWPVTYDELEPYYSRAEHELGVAGAQGPLTTRTPRSADYPMPPFGTERSRDLLGAAADALGWGWDAIPLAINTVPRNGRPACVRCPQCVGHACPVDAKNGAHNTFVPLALATGRASLLMDAEAVHVADGGGAATVTLMSDRSGEPVELVVAADVVVVSAGAVETPRLLLASGLGNDQLGRNLHDHRFVPVLGLVDPPAKSYTGPGHSVATLDHVHAPTIPWGGGVLVDLMTILPLTMAGDPPVAGVPRWGAGHKRWMREGRANVFGVFGMGQEVPLAASRVTLADARDRWGRPGARIRKGTHPASLEVEAGMAHYAAQWLRAAGATEVGVRAQRATASAAGEHSSGTARMGDDPARSATGADGRLHGARRIWVADASLHPTNGSVNPALTVVANSLRVAERLLAAWP